MANQIEEALLDSIKLISFWGAYVDDYMKVKHGFERDLAELRAVLERR